MFWNVHRKLMASHLLVVVITLGLVSLYLAFTLEDHFVEQLSDSMRRSARLAAELAATELGEVPSDGKTQKDLQTLAIELSRTAGARVTLIAPDGTVLGDSETDPRFMDNHKGRPEVSDALRNGVGESMRDSETLGVNMKYVAARIERDGKVLGLVRLAVPRHEIVSLASHIRLSVLTVGSLALVLGLTLSLLSSHGVVSRLNEVSAAVASMAKGDLTARVRIHEKDEIGQLAANFNSMAEELGRMMKENKGRRKEMEAILGAMNDGVIAVDSVGRVVAVNPAAVEMFDLAKSRTCGKHFLEAIRSYEIWEMIEECMATGEHGEREIKTISPTERVVQAHAAPVEHPRAGVVVVLHDVTGLRRLERVRSEFVANVSHELRTPVTSIKGFADTLLDGALEDPETARRFVSIISREANRLAQLISDLLDLSRLESKDTEIRKIPVNITELAENALLTVEPLAKDRKVTLENKFEGPIMVAGDPGLLTQVLVNLLDNAIKYNETGGSVSIGAEERESDVLVWVKDTGIGIEEHHLGRLFERFYRVDKDRSRRRGGTGLGLSITKHIVERHGGTIGVDSIPGKGSTFYFTVPKPVACGPTEAGGLAETGGSSPSEDATGTSGVPSAQDENKA